MPEPGTYALKSAALARMAAPDLPYQPPTRRAYRLRIGLAACRKDMSAGFTTPAALVPEFMEARRAHEKSDGSAPGALTPT